MEFLNIREFTKKTVKNYIKLLTFILMEFNLSFNIVWMEKRAETVAKLEKFGHDAHSSAVRLFWTIDMFRLMILISRVEHEDVASLHNF